MKNLKYIFLLLISMGFSQEKYQKVRIHYNSKEELQQIIRDNEIDHFHQKKGTYIECEIPKTFVENLKISGKKVDVIIDDMQEFVQQNINSRNANLQCDNNNFTFNDPINYNAGSMAGFLTFEECMAELDEMRTLYPNLITAKSNVGTILTFENRSLQFVKISDNPEIDETEKRILFDAVHHAREPGSMQQLIYFMWYILENYSSNLEVKNLVDNTEIFCIPIVNPDGYIYNQTATPAGGGLWRKNRRDNLDGNFGVDNNRNYAYGWGTTGITFNTNGQTYCGTAAFSEPENQAIKWFCEQKNFLVAMNAHTYSSLVLYPFGNEINSPTVDDNIFKGISGEMVKYNGYVNQLAADLYPASGDSDDWMYADITTKSKIFAFTPEVGGSFWDTPEQTLINNRNMLYTNLTALRFMHNFASFEDKTDKIISSTNFNFDFSLKRLGLVDNENFVVTIIPFSANISSVSNPLTFTSLAYNLDSNNSFQVNLNPNIAQGEPIIFLVEVNNGISTQEYTITKYFGNKTIVFNEVGDNLSQWTATVTSWNTTNTTFYSANSSITDSPNGDYLINKASTFRVTNPINLSNALQAELSFYAKWDIEKSFDYVVLEIQKNAGVWTPQCGLFTNLGTANQISGKPLYDGNQSTWVQEKINLSDYLGSNISIRFRFKSDGEVNGDGFYFDDMKVTTLNSASLSNDNFVFDNLIISPNPASTTLNFNTISEIENYKIHTISGQLLASDKVNLNKIDISNLSNGVYFLELNKNEIKKVFKFVVQK